MAFSIKVKGGQDDPNHPRQRHQDHQSQPHHDQPTERQYHDRLDRCSDGLALCAAAGEEAQKTPPIPLPSYHISRTKSELQLSEEMQAAEQRDIDMSNRVLAGFYGLKRQAIAAAGISRTRPADVNSGCVNASTFEQNVRNDAFYQRHNIHMMSLTMRSENTMPAFPATTALQTSLAVATDVTNENSRQGEWSNSEWSISGFNEPKNSSDDEGIFHLDL